MLARSLGEAPAVPPREAVDAVQALSRQSGCDFGVVALGPAGIPDALLQARVAVALGRFDLVGPRASPLLGSADPFVAAEARWDLALAHSRQRVPSAAGELEDAAWWAEAARREDLATLAWLELASEERLRGREKEAQRAHRQAQAALERTQDPAALAWLKGKLGEESAPRPSP
jgi:hypothetical protein